MAGPQPVAVEDDGDDESDDAVEQRLDELQEAEEDAAAEAESESNADDPFDSDEEIDLDLAETNVGEDIGDDDPFDGTDAGGESAFEEEAAEHGFDGAAGGFEDGDMGGMGGMDITDGTLPTTLNEGAAKLAVLGLPEEFEHHGETKTKQDLQDEFEEVFETFKLGEFGAEVAEEYLFVEDDGVDPLVAFTCSLALCTVIVAMSRPDSDEIVSKAKSRFDGMAGGVPTPGGI